MKSELKEGIAKTISENVTAGQELTIREGKALELREPVKVKIDGVLDSPARWLEKRVDTIEQLKCHVIVNRDDLKIILICDEKDYYRTQIGGSLTLSDKFQKFGINAGEYLTNFEMADLFKMNRTCFETRDKAMKLVSELQNFRAKVDKDIEKADNNRGDKKLLINQAVQSNLPDKFNLKMPVFKGTKEQTFEVEVYINASDFSCTLISPEANDLVEEMRNREIDAVLDRIKAVCPDVVIIEQ